MKETIHQQEFVDEIRVCPLCGYADGFHTMLKKEKRTIKWYLICSNCHEIFDYGLSVPR